MNNIIGNKYGKLTVIQKLRSSKYGIVWLCSCECGNIRESIGVNLKLGKTVSCGCGRRGNNSAHFSGYKEIGSHYWGHLLSNAKIRGIDVSITKEEVWDLYEKQNRRCALTGIPIIIATKNQTASLDRIDNSKNYEIDNLQWLHKDVNKMKNVHEQSYFIYLCRLISENSSGCN